MSKPTYRYTLLKPDGTELLLPTSYKKTLEQLQEIVGGYIELVPREYYKSKGWGRCTVYVNDEARFDSSNQRNPHFNVLHDALIGEMDIVGLALREEKYS